MSDNRIRCLLAYRLTAEPVVLAKYDHASQDETHSGSAGDSRTIYGGRDKKYADAVASVIGNDRPGQVSESSKIGGFKVVQSEVHQVIYGADNDGICLAVITGLKYPSRVAIQLLQELYLQFSEKFSLQVKALNPQFSEKFELQVKAATSNSLSKKAKPMFISTCQKYDNPNNVDKASSLIEKVDQVKSTMSDNIAVMLNNTENAETIAQQTEQLSEQAIGFKKKSIDIKKKMRWKNTKRTLLLIAIVTGTIIIIVIPIILKAKHEMLDE